MGGSCHYCGKFGTVKAYAAATGQSHWLCSDHAKSAQNVQDGKNSGANAGIG